MKLTPAKSSKNTKVSDLKEAACNCRDTTVPVKAAQSASISLFETKNQRESKWMAGKLYGELNESKNFTRQKLSET